MIRKCYLIIYETATDICEYKAYAQNETYALDNFYFEVIMEEGEDGRDRDDINVISVQELTYEPYIGMTFEYEGNYYRVAEIDEEEDVLAEKNDRYSTTRWFTLDEIREYM